MATSYKRENRLIRTDRLYIINVNKFLVGIIIILYDNDHKCNK
jgi:hypothetical protein